MAKLSRSELGRMGALALAEQMSPEERVERAAAAGRAAWKHLSREERSEIMRKRWRKRRRRAGALAAIVSLLCSLATVAEAQTIQLTLTQEQVVPSGWGTYLAFHTVRGEIEGSITPLPDGAGVRIEVAGWYDLRARIAMEVVEGQSFQRALSIIALRGGAAFASAGDWDTAPSHAGTTPSVAEILYLVPGDELRVRAFQNSGGDRIVVSDPGSGWGVFTVSRR